MSRRSGHSQNDDRGQGPICDEQRARYGRLVLSAPRLAVPLGRVFWAALELGAAQPDDALADGKSHWDCPGTKAAASGFVELPSPGRAPPPHAADAADRRQGALFR